jgi:AAA+ ATPase superfamily predicted ATPase
MSEHQRQLVNPYVAGPTVFGKSFFGRDQIFQKIHEALVTSQQRLLVLHGQRRIGKSSILRELPQRLPAEQFVTVNFDLQFYAGQSLAKVLLALAQSISQAFELLLPDGLDFEKDELFFETVLLEAVEAYLKENQRLLILIDEFDIVRETEKERVPVASREFTALLQRLINSEERLSFVLVAGSSLGALPGYMQSVFRLGGTVEVTFLDKDEARDLIIKPARNTLVYSEPAIEAVFNIANGHPYFTQLLCQEIFNQAAFSKSMAVGLDEVEAATKRSLVSGMGAFSWIWNELTLAERVYLSAVASAATKHNVFIVSDKMIQQILEEYNIRLLGTDLPNAARDLASRKFLQVAGPHQYRITVELIRRWMEKEHLLDNTKQDIENINPIANSKYEEARKAHAAGHLEQAIEHYQAAVRGNPNYARAQIGLAQALYEKGDWERAVIEFERACYLDEARAKPSLVEALLAYGRYLEKQDADKALSIYKRVFDYAPGNIQARTRIDRLKPPSLFHRLVSAFSIGFAFPQRYVDEVFKTEQTYVKSKRTYVETEVPEKPVLDFHTLKLIPKEWPNPYIVGPPVTHPNFFGRDKIISDVFTTLENSEMNLVVLYGQRRIGKTSVLYEISRRGSKSSHVFVFMNLAELGQLSTENFFYQLAREISKTMNIESLDLEHCGDVVEYFEGQLLLKVYQELGKRRLVILLDEVCYSPTMYDQNTINFLASLNRFISRERKISFVIVIGPEFHRFSGPLGQITKLGPTIQLQRMRDETACRLITEPAADYLVYTPEALNRILDLSARHPFLIQSICYELFNLLIINRGERHITEVKAADVDQALEMALKSGIAGFTWLMHILTEEEQAFLHMCAEESGSDGRFNSLDLHRRFGPISFNTCDFLIKIDVLEKVNNNTYHFVSEMFRRWSSLALKPRQAQGVSLDNKI